MTTQIEVEHNKKKISGILINETKDFLTIKLNSGYNANFKKENIKEISRKNINFDKKKSPVLKRGKTCGKNLSKISIIHTGGTIASKVDYKTGAVSSKFTPDELLSLYPELNKKVNITATMIGNLFSEDMRFAHYNLMLKEIENGVKEGVKGIIISHGTDTMHYTSCTLQYACRNLPIPILLVGAQRSSDRASSDAYSNLSTAVNFILNMPNFRRVGICMHNTICDNSFTILDSINAKKMHSTRRDAFKQINYLPIAKITNSKIEILREELLSKKKPKEIFSYTKYNENLKIGFFKAHPNLFSKELDLLSFYDAIIIEGTGLGHLAIDVVDEETKIHKENLEALKNLSRKIKLIMGTQTIYGSTNMNIYSSGREIQKYVLGNFMNLTTETLFIRTAYCLSQKKKSFEEKWKENLEGFEIRNEDLER